MVLNVGRTKPENGQEQPTTDMTTTKQREVTYSIINANNGIYLEKKNTLINLHSRNLT